MYRAIRISPENEQVIREQLDLVVLDMYTEPTVRYIVDGFILELIGWRMFDEEDFHKEWRFLFDAETPGAFQTVIPREINHVGSSSTNGS